MSDICAYDALSLYEAAAAAQGKWHLLHTRSRQEKALAETLSAQGIAHFLPLATVGRSYAGRKVTVEMPLFPGYVFLKGSLDQVYSADRTKRVAGIIPVVDQDRIGRELRNLAQALASRASLDPYPFLRAGVRVCVRSGPLMGLEGVIESRNKRDRLILQVEVLGQATSLEIDGAILEVIE
ncbi:MAG: transcription termination/antitermination protein NusG [Phycisphaerae bacterium]